MEKKKTAWQGLRLGFEFFGAAPGRHVTLPLQRSPVLIVILIVVAAIFTFPALSVIGHVDSGLTRDSSLFDLTTNLFSIAWLLGWSMGLLIIYSVLIMACVGREMLVLRPGEVEYRFGLPFVFLRHRFDPGRIEEMQRVIPEANSGQQWRGPYVRFTYDGSTAEFGSNLSEARAEELIALVRSLPASTSSTRATRETSNSTLRAQAQTPQQAGPEAEQGPVGLHSPSSLLLILVNLLPIAGVIWLGWDLGMVMILFWAESGIIGVFNILKMLVINRWGGLFAGIFFLGHYGGFMAVHLMFLYSIFVTGLHERKDESIAEVTAYFAMLWPMLLALFLSHGLSFFSNFIGRREYIGKRLRDQMGEPYQRIMLMHVTIIIGGGISLISGQNILALVLLVGLKIAADVRGHLRQRVQKGFA